MKIVVVHKFGSTPHGPGAAPPAGLEEAGNAADVVVAVDSAGARVVKGKTQYTAKVTVDSPLGREIEIGSSKGNVKLALNAEGLTVLEHEGIVIESVRSFG